MSTAEMSLWEKYKKIPILKKIFVGLVAGVLWGVFLPEYANYVAPIGTIFIDLIKMIVIPLVFSTLIVGMNSLQSGQEASRVGFKTLVTFTITSLIAISVGLFLSTVINTGAMVDGLTLKQAATYHDVKVAPPFIDVIIAMIPTNIVSSMAKGQMLPIIVFSVMFGLAMNSLKGKVDVLYTAISEMAKTSIKLIQIIMRLAPYGVFGLLAKSIAAHGISVLMPLLGFAGIVYLAYFVQICLVYPALLMAFRLNPWSYLSALRELVAISYSTSSSSASLPVTMRTAVDKLGVPPAIASFILPLGATINMDGTSMYLGMFTVFVAQLYGVDLTVADYLLALGTIYIAGVGVAGVPGASIIMMPVILGALHLPIEAIGIILAVDRLLDMGRTVVNVSGDVFTSCVVAHTEGSLDMQTYNNHPEPEDVEIVIHPK